MGKWGVENQCHWVLDVVFGEDQIKRALKPSNLRQLWIMGNLYRVLMAANF